MRDIERFVAAVFLVAAVGGTAVFAHQLGSSERTAPVELAAPPRQHVSAPGGAVWAAPLPAPVRVLTRPKRAPAASRVLRPVAPFRPGRPIVIPAVTKPKPVRHAAPAPAPTPEVAAGPAPTPVAAQQTPSTPEPTRVLAATAPAATTAAPAAPAPAVAEHGRGRKLGHEKQAKRGKMHPDDVAEAAPAPAPVPVAPAPAPTPEPAPAAAPAPPAAAADTGPGNGNGRGHAYGHAKTHGD